MFLSKLDNCHQRQISAETTWCVCENPCCIIQPLFMTFIFYEGFSITECSNWINTEINPINWNIYPCAINAMRGNACSCMYVLYPHVNYCYTQTLTLDPGLLAPLSHISGSLSAWLTDCLIIGRGFGVGSDSATGRWWVEMALFRVGTDPSYWVLCLLLSNMF